MPLPPGIRSTSSGRRAEAALEAALENGAGGVGWGLGGIEMSSVGARTDWQPPSRQFACAQPTHNSNSREVAVAAGDTLHGKIVYSAATDSYELTQTKVETGEVSSQVVRCQRGKKYRVPYVVCASPCPALTAPPPPQAGPGQTSASAQTRCRTSRDSAEYKV